MSIDLRGALRRVKPTRRVGQMRVRATDGQPDDATAATAAFVIDTNVYIHRAAGRLPDRARVLIDRGIIFHCSVCLGELAVGLGNYDPRSSRWADTQAYQIALFESLLAPRILTPDPEIWAEAGLIAGVLARTQQFQPHQRKECLNDALIFLTAAKVGLPVLTENRDDFDLIQQVAGRGHFIWF